jgi:hypothetical protein
MNSSSNKIPILIIEDDPEHAGQITQRLGDAYDAVHVASVDPVKLYNYKATYPNSQIIIVDLVLNTQDNAHEGLKTIRYKLWPFDRTAFFVVFSQYLEERTAVDLNTFGPHCAFVKKKVAAGNRLTAKCLRNLVTIVEECVEYSSPLMDSPQYEVGDWTQQLDEYKLQSKVSLEDSVRDVADNISRSIQVLNELATATTSYAKAGNASRQVAIGIFGSCGRLEMRKDSDIECTVYFRDLTNDLVASTFWNRITRYIAAKADWSYNYEGHKDIKESATGFLLPDQEGEKIENKFFPLIRIERFLEANIDTDPELRDRHFQILTELRGVFNPDLIFQMKKEMILKHCGTSDLRAIVESAYMQKIVSQYFIDLAPQSLEQWGDFKRFCYRTLNVLALQLFFIRRLAVDTDLRLDDGHGWANLFNSLCDPGIVKVLQFQQVCKGTLPAAQSERIMDEVHVLIERYFYMYSRFVNTQPGERANLRSATIRTIDQFVTVLDNMKLLEFFRPVRDNQLWLFGTDKIVALKNQLQ